MYRYASGGMLDMLGGDEGGRGDTFLRGADEWEGWEGGEVAGTDEWFGEERVSKDGI